MLFHVTGTGTGIPLTYQDMTGKDFKGQKLYKADLRGTNFTKADMKGISLFGAFCKDAKFNGADLSNADLESVDFDGADLSEAILEGAQVGTELTSISRDFWYLTHLYGVMVLQKYSVILIIQDRGLHAKGQDSGLHLTDRGEQVCDCTARQLLPQPCNWDELWHVPCRSQMPDSRM